MIHDFELTILCTNLVLKESISMPIQVLTLILYSLEIISCRNFFLMLPFQETTKTFEATTAAFKKSDIFLILRDNEFAKSD